MVRRSAVFDYTRLVGAVLVLVGHAYVLLGFHPPTVAGTGIHEIGVKLFFAVSGYLIAASWNADPHFVRFTEKRLRRIMPALIVVVSLTVFIVGPVLTTDLSYWRSPVTWTYLWRNYLLLPFHSLPGVFGGNPLAVVNGSLWTLPVEAFCYALTPLFIRCGVTGCAAGAVGLLAFPINGEIGGFGLAGASSMIPWFLVGAAARQASAKLPELGWPALPVDLSFGIYLTAYPVTQIIIAIDPAISVLRLALTTATVSTGLAYFLWTFIERPAIQGRRQARSA
jgi:peptidoglycan/LPS O-acetylase OafA/YrhL